MQMHWISHSPLEMPLFSTSKSKFSWLGHLLGQHAEYSPVAAHYNATL